jgi:hypothetical protein
VERLRRAVQRRPAGRAVLAAGLASALSLGSATTRAQAPAAAPSPEAASPAEIVAARELFRQGTEDADAGRYAEGLEKFRRVAAVKETAPVRFNIARCEEALGKTGAALADFELAAREGHEDPKASDVATLAGQRADALRPRVPRLTVVARSPAPDGMSVSLDGGKLASLGVGLPLDPGAHVVDAKAPGSPPFHAEVTLVEGEAKKIEISLSPSAEAPGAEAGASPGASSSQSTWGWVTVAGGGALALGSVVFLVLHNDAVSTLNGDCPGQRCPAAQEPQIDGTASNARTYEALSIALIAASAVAVGVGVVLFATAPGDHAQSVAVTAGAPAAPAGLSLRASF